MKSDSAVWNLHPDRLFSSDPVQRHIAQEIYEKIYELPIFSPHGHVDPWLFSRSDSSFGTPTELFIIPDHYVFRLLYSQGIPMESLGNQGNNPDIVEKDHKRIWQAFAENYSIFRGTPSGLWLDFALNIVLDIHTRLNAETAQVIYNDIEQKISTDEFHPRQLFEKFKIECLCTTDSATDSLEAHQIIHESAWNGQVRPTFRPDSVINLHNPGWGKHLENLGIMSGIEIHSFSNFIRALEVRREFFKKMGALSTDHGAASAYTDILPLNEVESIFHRALTSEVTEQEAIRFNGHMLVEMARMSSEDGLVMQLHPGSFRNHSSHIFNQFGPDKGFDIPLSVEFTRNLHPLLERFGHHPNFTILLFTLDESTYSRELAPLAGVYPTIKLGPPWWFLDSPNGMRRYLDHVVETAGIANLAGFNDDTRAFLSIPARHDVWRRVCSDWLAEKVAQHRISLIEAKEMAQDLAIDLARKAYRCHS